MSNKLMTVETNYDFETNGLENFTDYKVFA